MGYGSGDFLFGQRDQMLMCIPDPEESKIVRNITRSVGFLEIEDRLSQVKKRKLSHHLAYTSIKVIEGLSFLFQSNFYGKYIQLICFVFVMRGLMLSKALRIQQENEEKELMTLQDEVEKLRKSLEEKEIEAISFKEKMAKVEKEKEEAATMHNVDTTRIKEHEKSISELCTTSKLQKIVLLARTKKIKVYWKL
jgi:hypothetical protein